MRRGLGHEDIGTQGHWDLGKLGLRDLGTLELWDLRTLGHEGIKTVRHDDMKLETMTLIAREVRRHSLEIAGFFCHSDFT